MKVFLPPAYKKDLIVCINNNLKDSFVKFTEPIRKNKNLQFQFENN